MIQIEHQIMPEFTIWHDNKRNKFLGSWPDQREEPKPLFPVLGFSNHLDVTYIWIGLDYTNCYRIKLNVE